MVLKKEGGFEKSLEQFHVEKNRTVIEIQSKGYIEKIEQTTL